MCHMRPAPWGGFPMQIGALAMCRVEAGVGKGCEDPCYLAHRYPGSFTCRCPKNTGRRRLTADAEAASRWRDGAVDVLSVACAPELAGSPQCESEEGVMDALHNKVSL